MKIYTKSGDKGQTSLIGGQRVSKADPRVEAYGTVDELSAHVAMLKDMLSAAGVDEDSDRLTDILRTLMTVEAALASGENEITCEGENAEKVYDVAPERITALESDMDMLSAITRPLANFTIPGGHVIVSQAHVCRTVCRRAEREACRAAEMVAIPENALTYLNRLSDYFYILGRRLSEILGAEETVWIP